MKKTVKFKIISIALMLLLLVQLMLPIKSYATDVPTKNYYYISDMDYISANKWSYVGWGKIKKDKNIEGKKISLLVDGEKVFFNKGMGVHATSQLTYDISTYSNKYTRFVAKLGVDSSKNGLGDVWFKISVSNDGKDWKEIYKSDPVTSQNNALEIDLNIKNYKYLRLYADQNGSNAVDHAVYADARLVEENYNIKTELFNEIEPLSYYDNILNKNSVEENYKDNLELVFKRELVNRLGYWNIQTAVRDDSTKTMKETLTWILNDMQNLQLFIESGNINNSEKFLIALNNLYTNNKKIIGDDKDGLIYKKMLIALAFAYSSDIPATPLTFNSPMASYDINKRFDLVKNLYDNNLMLYKEDFKNYEMELLRFIMNNSIANDELNWLREYAEYKYADLNKRLNPYNYMNYIHPKYNQDRLYSKENEKQFNEKYLLDKYNIKYGLNDDETKTPKTWMVMEAGGICWNISRLGQNLARTHGIPSVGVYQPAHEAYLNYSLNSDKKGIWSLGNNIFGWGKSSTSWYGGNVVRLLFNWNNKSFTVKPANDSKAGNSAGYQLLGQAALNEYDKYLESYFYYLIANSYSDLNKKEEIYNKSLSILDINLDDYDKLITIYKEIGNKTSTDWKNLAKKIIDAYTYYPMAMVDLLKLIEPNLDNTDAIEIDMLKTESLKTAADAKKTATNKDTIQPDATAEIAEVLLGTSKVDLASFSFDGENANKIVMNSKYDNYDFQVQYSLDGGNTWIATLNHVITLTKKQVKSINSKDDIKVKISGSSQIFTIDITNGETVDDLTLNMNDDENIFIGKTDYLEYSSNDGISWNDYNNQRFETKEKIKVRYKSHGTTLNGEIREYHFTKNDDKTLEYVYVENINYIQSGSFQGGFAPENMIDGSPFTSWHTKWGEVAQDKTYVISFNKAKYLSQISYDPAGLNGRIKTAKIYISLDGVEWNLVKNSNVLANDTNRKYIKLDESVAARFVKIEATETYGNHEGPNKYVSGTRFNYYEDTTKEFKEPEIEYSINSITNKDVEAKIKLTYGCTSIGKNSHTFTENGMYTFKYKDVNGEEKELIAKVTWIDKIIPTATVEYDVTGETQFQVKATLKNISKKNVTIIDGSDGTYTFTKNGEYTFKIRDNAGNIGEIVAKVTRIEEKQEIEEIIKGDINGDGVFDIVELTILNKHLIETQRIIDSKWLIAADLNKDGKIDIVDLSILNKKINK